MGLPGAPVLAVPLVALGALAVGLIWTHRRAGSTTVLRLGAALAAAWAVVATTALAAVLTLGGPSVLWKVAADPDLLFAPAFASVWLDGALGALGLLVLAFWLNQAVGWGWLRLFGSRPAPWPERLPRPQVRTSLRQFDCDRPEACSFTLVEAGPLRSGGLRRHEVVLLSTGLLALLTEEELEAVVAHELGHLLDLDGRYLTFCRTFARMMRWDPVLAFLAASLTREEEYRADLRAARATRRPRALARALFKVATARPSRAGAATFVGGAGLLGNGGERGRREAFRRIERLLELDELPEYREHGER